MIILCNTSYRSIAKLIRTYIKKYVKTVCTKIQERKDNYIKVLKQ